MKNAGHTLLWAATHMGGLHQRMGLCNQDAHALRLWKDRALCVVADGVGSAALSHEGARAICRLAVQFFSTLPEQAEVDAMLAMKPGEVYTPDGWNYYFRFKK